MDWTWSEIVNLAAVTIVVLIRAEGLLRAARSRGNNPSGSVSVSLPKHSATTLRVPSSLHSQWRNRRSQIWGTKGRSCAMASVPSDNEVITSFNECSNKYWRRDWVSICVKMKGKNAGRFPTATEPRACEAADFTYTEKRKTWTHCNSEWQEFFYLFIWWAEWIDNGLSQTRNLMEVHSFANLSHAEQRKDMLPIRTRSLSLLEEILHQCKRFSYRLSNNQWGNSLGDWMMGSFMKPWFRRQIHQRQQQVTITQSRS